VWYEPPVSDARIDEFRGDRPRVHATRGQAPAGRLGLFDGRAREVRYLRLSITDRCNLRCVYCMPARGGRFSAHEALLTFEEIERLVRVFVRLGVNRVRLTGGEPLVRRGVVDLVRRVASVPGIEDVAATTNGALLPALAEPLAAAGLDRVNVSLDSLRPERFQRLTRRGDLGRVLAGIEAARAAGLTPLKLNAVVVRGENDDELGDLVRFAAAHDAVLRFIEYMPLGSAAPGAAEAGDSASTWGPASFVPGAEMVEHLRRAFQVSEPLGGGAQAGLVGEGPAVYREVRAPGLPPVRVGFIRAVSESFCSTCNRVRLSATGTLQECLAYPGRLSLRDALRAGASDAELEDVIRDALAAKGPGHRFGEADGGGHGAVTMSGIGG